MHRSSLRLVLLLATTLGLGGCLTATGGFTERQWNTALAALKPGLTQRQLLDLMGEPRERVPADPGETAFTETWIYSRPERAGTRTERVGEHDILLPNGKDIQSIPDYEDRDIMVIAEYHLHWQGEVLAAWDRIVTRPAGSWSQP